MPKKERNSKVLAKDAKYMVRPWSTPPGEPVHYAEAKGCKIKDDDGKEFIDFTSGYFVNNVGHCHPGITEAATAQMQRVLQVSGKHTTEAVVDLAEALVERTPSKTTKAFFATGGSEAVEFALKAARQYTGKKKIAYLRHGYHGLTYAALACTWAPKYRESAGVPIGLNEYEIPNAYCYRCPHAKNDHEDCTTQCLDGVDELFANNPDTAAVIAEPAQAAGGIIPPKKWWERLDELRKKHDMLLIVDEIQTGCGRTGTMFACEHYGLDPEIITGGKGLSGGVGSLSVVLMGDEIAKDFYAGTTPTSGGNAVSAAAGKKLIEIIEEEKLLENCQRASKQLTEEIWALNDPWVGDVRYFGLLGGVELVSDKASKEPLPKETMAKIRDGLYDEGMLLTVTGPHGNCLRVQPALTISAEEVSAFVKALDKVLKAVRG